MNNNLLTSAKAKTRLCLLTFFMLLNASQLLATELPAPVDGVLTITVTAQGELYSSYPAADIQATGATKLKIVGPLNNGDLDRVRGSLNETLTQLDLSEAVFTALPGRAFDSKSTLTAITLPNNLTSISYGCFWGCTSLASISLPSSLTTIDTNAFYCCSALASVAFPSSLTTLNAYAFNGCAALESIDLSQTHVTSIGSGAFGDCTSLTSVSLPDGITSLESSVFSRCTSLQSLDLSHTGLTEVPGSTCSQCTSLTSVQLPATITTIGGSAFYGCSSLPSVTINVTGALTINSSAFSYCSLLTAITINAGGDVNLGTYYRPIESCPALETFELHTPGKLTATCSHLFNDRKNLTTAILDAQGEGSAMGEYAFDGCTSLTTVTLPASLTTINTMFFYHCEALTSVTVPSTITSIGNSAFNGCKALESLDLSATQLTSIGNSAFDGCKALESLDLSTTQLTTIGSSAFYGCTSLASVLLPAGITSLDNSVFSQCSSLQSLDLSQALITAIPSSTCHQCTSLTSVQLPATITSIGANAFYQCPIASFSCTSNGALTIERDAFYYCRQMTDLSLTASGALSIKESAFYNCKALRNVTINAGGDVTLGTSSGNAFNECSAMEDFELHTPGKVSVRERTFYNYPTSALRRCWLDARGAGSTIGQYAFDDCHNLETLLLPAGLTSIGRGAFSECNSLTAIELPASTTIPDGYDLFQNCSSLESIDLSQLQITAIGERAFYGCSSLTTVVLPDGFTTINDGMFNGCSQLTDITLPATVTTIGQNAFYNCSSLPAITVPASVTTMGKEVFRYCSSLTTASVLADIATLPQYTFDGCSSLRTVTMSRSNITTIGERAFDGCSQLTDITLPLGLTTLGQYTFNNCSSLTTISLPSTLTTFNNGVFDGCSSLISLEIPEGVSELPQSLFSDCSGMQSLYLPSTITTIHYSAWYGLSGLIDLHIQAETPPVLTSPYGRASQVTLFVPEASIGAYQKAQYWNEFGHIYAELTNLASLDDGEYALLQSIFNQTDGTQWTRPWTFGATKAETSMLEGVKVNDGHVVQLALINNNLTGTLPPELMEFPNVWYVNVSGNHFSGDIGAYFDNMTTNNVITHLDLSDNQLTGNIGRMAFSNDKLPALTSFKIARNKIRDVKPVLPAHIKTLDIKGQDVDFDNTYDFTTFVTTPGTNLPDVFPSILSYDHSKKNYGNVHYLLSAPDADEPWTVYVQKNGSYFYVSSYGYSGSGWNFLPAGSTIYLSDNVSNIADRIRLHLNFDYTAGDVNYNNTVDVSDLQTLINHAIYPEGFARYTPFNWAAANLAAADGEDPETINVQDVVVEVNLLLSQYILPVIPARQHRAARPQQQETEAEATLDIVDGQLVLTSSVPVAAMHLQLSADDARWQSATSLLSHRQNNGRHVFYSMDGDQLSPGTHVLAQVDKAQIEYAMMVDRDGRPINCAVGQGTTTGITTATVPAASAAGSRYTLSGMRTTSQAKGVYIVDGKKYIVK